MSVDGEEVGIVEAGGVKRISLVPGEHLIGAVCGGRRWKDTVAVGKEQKVVTIPPGSAPLAPAAASAPKAPVAAPPEVGTGCVLLFDPDRAVAAGRWRVGAVIQGTPCSKAQIRAGSVALSLGLKKAKDFTVDDTTEFQTGGGIGSTVDLEVLDRDGELRKVTLARAAIPEAGTVDVIQPDGETVKSVSFGRDLPLRDALRAAVAAGKPAPPSPTPGIASSGTSLKRTCTGVPVACGLRNSAVCTLGAGCIAGGRCGGFSTQTCFGKSQYACATTPGCFWQAVTKICTGMGQTCAGQLSMFACNAVTGCSWTATCTGVATPCSSLSEVLCALQPGCSIQ